MLRVVHFEIHADDPERAVKFYKNIFKWEFKKWEGPMEYWLIMTGPSGEQGIDGGLMKRNEKEKGERINSYVCTIDVPDIDDFTKKIKDNGGKIVMKKNSIPKVGWFAYCKDTEGNFFGIMQNDSSAA